jgi:hypothetical protein
VSSIVDVLGNGVTSSTSHGAKDDQSGRNGSDDDTSDDNTGNDYCVSKEADKKPKQNKDNAKDNLTYFQRMQSRLVPSSRRRQGSQSSW